MVKIPNPQEFCIDTGLYEKFDISHCSAEEIAKFEEFVGTIDTYCIECKKDSTFERRNKPEEIFKPTNSKIAAGLDPRFDKYRNREIVFVFTCSREKSHCMRVYFYINDSKISKVGQYPSLADIHLPSIAKYRKVLGEQYYKELARAIGLNAHGIGIGSFIYLRRILERLLENAHEKARNQEDWNEEVYDKLRVPEKIKALSNFLPQIMVKNAEIYSILSKGLHELSEDECQSYFEAIKGGIELILDRTIEQIETTEKEKRISSDISKIKGNFKEKN